jgi:UDP-glucose:(heptosyl)LPS alpha-1,3-glucosyltransferase
MRVALSFPGCHRQGGVERVLFECARYLASRDHQVMVFASRWGPEDLGPVERRHVRIRQHPALLRGLSYRRETVRQLRNTSFDVLSTHGCVCPEGGVHWVQSVHKAWLERSQEFRPRFSSAWVRQRLNPAHPLLLAMEARHFRSRSYRKLIVTTQRVRDDLHRLYQVPADDTVVIPNGFAPQEFNPERRERRREEARRRLGLRPDEIVMLFVANELERKGFTTVLSAMRLLDRNDLRLLVVGRVDGGQARAQAVAFGLDGRVDLHGPSDDVALFHAAGDLLVLPTQYEAFSLAILEALGSGVPVVTTNVPGAADAIRPGVNGLLVEQPGDAVGLASALESVCVESTRRRLSEAAPRTVRSHQWPSVLARYERVLTEHRA